MDKMISKIDKIKAQIAQVAKESPTYEKLAYYIDKNLMRIIFMTANEVAVENNVSQGSVSRFCTSLGYRGYNDFLRNVQKYVSKEITAPQRFQYTSQNNNNQKISNILEMEHKNIDEISALLHHPSYEKLVSLMLSAHQLVLISARMSATLLPYTCYLLNKIRDGVSSITPHLPQWDTLSLRNPKETVFISFAFPRYPNVLLSKMEELHTAGFQVVAITDSLISPASAVADLTIPVPVTSSSIFDIYSAPLLFINLLIRNISKGTPGLSERLQLIEQQDEAHGIYYKR